MIDDIQQAMLGDEEAFQRLITQQHASLYRMIYAYVHNEIDAIEVFQNVVVKAFYALSTLQQPTYFVTWLMRIAINESVTFMKKQAREPSAPIEQFMHIADHVPSPDENIDLWQALNELNDQYKTVLLLRYYQDYTVVQIAEVTQLPEGTVKTSIRRGLQQLKKRMKGAYYDDFQSFKNHDE